MGVSKLSCFPEIESQRLQLIEQTIEYQQQVFELLSDSDVTKYYDLHLTEIKQARELIEADINKFKNGDSLRWIIQSKNSNEFIGSCGINRFESANRSAVISYELCKSAWGKGYATEVVTALADFIFSEKCSHNINKIEAYVMQANTASETVLTKVGFIKEGVLREHGFWKGQFHDLSLFTLLRSEFKITGR